MKQEGWPSCLKIKHNNEVGAFLRSHDVGGKPRVAEDTEQSFHGYFVLCGDSCHTGELIPCQFLSPF